MFLEIHPLQVLLSDPGLRRGWGGKGCQMCIRAPGELPEMFPVS